MVANIKGHVATRGDISSPTSGDLAQFLTPELTQRYFDLVEKSSIIQQLCRKIPMGPSGVRIPEWTGNVKAQWVAETGEKPITKGGFTKTDVVPHKIATIFVASAEVVRADPVGYLTTMRAKVAEAIALAFDQAVFNGAAAGSPWGQGILNAPLAQVSLADPLGAGKGPKDGSNAYTALNTGLQTLLDNKALWTGTVLTQNAEPVLNSAVDGNLRPLFTESPFTQTAPTLREGRILSRPAWITYPENVCAAASQTIGVMGDWSKVLWGQVSGITYDVSDQATLDMSDAQDGSGLTSLWARNLLAIRVEAEFGMVIHKLANNKFPFIDLISTVTA